jgi:hypothetical protein
MGRPVMIMGTTVVAGLGRWRFHRVRSTSVPGDAVGCARRSQEGGLADGEEKKVGVEPPLVLTSGLAQQPAPVGVHGSQAASQAVCGLLPVKPGGGQLEDPGLADAEAWVAANCSTTTAAGFAPRLRLGRLSVRSRVHGWAWDRPGESCARNALPSRPRSRRAWAGERALDGPSELTEVRVWIIGSAASMTVAANHCSRLIAVEREDARSPRRRRAGPRSGVTRRSPGGFCRGQGSCGRRRW